MDIRLPHEVEWEVAARWPDGRFYPWGNTFDSHKANTREAGISLTTAVGLYPSGRNEALELYDLSGNVWEWCRNRYNKPESDLATDEVDISSNSRVLRGGSWFSFQADARAASRDNLDPDFRYVGYGFRVVVVRFSPSHQGH